MQADSNTGYFLHFKSDNKLIKWFKRSNKTDSALFSIAKKQHLNFAAVVFSAFFCVEACAEPMSLLRVHCAAESSGAKIFVNGEHKDSCGADSVNMYLKAGEIKLRVVKQVDEEYERVFEQDIFLKEDMPQRINVALSAPRLTAEAIAKQTALRLEKEKAEAKAALVKAKEGDADAARTLAEFYREGKGLEQSAQKAQEWQHEAERLIAEKALGSAKAGSVADMRRIANFYSEGMGVDKNKQEAAYWNEKADGLLAAEEARKKEEQRLAALENKNKNIQAKIDNVSFFENTGNNISYHFNEMDKESRNDNYIESSMYLISVPFPTITGLIQDTVSAPTKTFDLISLKNELAARPSKFDNPDSMIAIAYLNRQKRFE